MAGNESGYKAYTGAASLKLSLLLVALSLFGCSDKKSNADSFFAEELACPSPAVAEFQAWGKSGTQHVCKIKHGPFVAWEGGYVHVRGQYENGKKTGVWYWYDKNGNVEKKIEYTRKNNGGNPDNP